MNEIMKWRKLMKFNGWNDGNFNNETKRGHMGIIVECTSLAGSVTPKIRMINC